MAQSARTIYAKTFLAFNQFAKDVIKQSRKNLATKRHRKYPSGRTVNSKIDNSGALSRSLAWIPKKGGGRFEMNNYGLVIDEGRKPGKYAPVDKINEWVKNKPVLPRDKRGRFMPRNDRAMKSLSFMINRSIKKNGIKPTRFFSDPLENNIVKLQKKLPDIVAQDIETYFNR